MRVVTLGLGVALLVVGCGGKQPSGAECVPAVAGQDDVAYLAVVEGEVTIRRGEGAPEPARQDMSLARADTVITGPDAMVVVVLANCHVLRLAEDQETQVGKLAQLDAPPPKRGFSEMFASALGTEDLSRIGGAERLERIAGWNARRASGETPAPVARSVEAPKPAPPTAEIEGKLEAPGAGDSPAIGRMAEPIRVPDAPDPQTAPSRSKGEVPQMDSKKVDDDSPTDAPTKKKESGRRPAEPTAPRPNEQDDSPGLGGATTGGGGGGGKTEEAKRAPDLEDGWTFETGDKEQVQKTSLPAGLAAKRAALAQCVADARPDVAAPQLRLRVADGAVAEVKLDGGSPPSCAKELVGLRLTGVDDGWMRVRVTR